MMFKPIVFANTIQSMSIILRAVERMGNESQIKILSLFMRENEIFGSFHGAKIQIRRFVKAHVHFNFREFQLFKTIKQI